MTKAKTQKLSAWVRNLREMMEKKGFNPRSLSLKAGLNATAVRDMMEGRSRFPRYDTVMALATALETSPAVLMGEDSLVNEIVSGGFSEDLEILTEVIARLQEVVIETKCKLTPHEFAAMATTIYKRIQADETNKKKMANIRPQIYDLLDYELLRQKRVARKA